MYMKLVSSSICLLIVLRSRFSKSLPIMKEKPMDIHFESLQDFGRVMVFVYFEDSGK
jgi:hypothetical protein